MATKNPIGFTKPKPMPREAEAYLSGNEKAEKETAEVPTRQPKVVPVFVGTIEGQEIMAAYDLYPLTPLSNLEQQMLQIIAALEQELAKHEHD
jgi:hypothetical protein